MIQYKGTLNKNTEAKIKANMQLVKSLINQPIGLSRPGSEISTIEETVEKYNPALTKDEIKAWVWYRRKLGIPMKAWSSYFTDFSDAQLLKLVQNEILFFDSATQSLVPYPVFLFGNLYTKESKLKKYKDVIENKYGVSVYNRHLEILNDAKPKKISIQNPIESERPVIMAISETADNFLISDVKESEPFILTQPESLKSVYITWLRNLDASKFKNTNAYEIINYYLNGERKPQRMDKIEWQAIKKLTKEQGEKLFKEFLHTALTTTDQLRIDAEYNSKYNATATLQYHKIPIGIEVSKTFGKNPLTLFPAQREGIAFMELVGSGIIAYDVGVGKTITAIVEMASAINNGKCKRPLVVVPNPTYKNWIKEIIGFENNKGILSGTDITLNEWYNLGRGYDDIDFTKKVPKNSITLVTYEGLQKIGFNQETQEKHFQVLSNILGQTSQSEREAAKQDEKFREIIGVGLKETKADIDDLGFDYVVVDEAHNFKNVFTSVKSEKGQKKQFEIQGGSASNRAIKLFFLCNYIQRTYGKNVMLLSATPFTNSPLEIYSMLSFVAYQYMVDNNILNIRQFFEQYIQETFEYVIGIDGEIKQKAVVKSFNNRISLQKLIRSHINFKTGEQANIPRPCKVNLPKTTVLTDEGIKKLSKDNQILTYLQLTDEQDQNQKIINEAASQGASKDDPGRLLRLMSQSLNNALTPFLYSGKPKDYLDFIENSPKIEYALQCVKRVKEWHEKRNQPESGQVIYIDRGKQFFGYIKEYLERELGYKTGQKLLSYNQKVDEVEIITGGISTTKKEKIKTAFNEGVCKIIIGTSTIKEGINLQKKSTVLYNLYPNWNPTDIRQLEGRIWRQKNENGYVRIVMPLMENSMDTFVFQKLDEKTSRINEIWNDSDTGNVLDEESLDPNEVKFALVTDIGVLLRFELKQIKEDLNSQNSILNSQIKDLETYEGLKTNYKCSKDLMIQKLNNAFTNLPNKFIDYDKNRIAIYLKTIGTINLEDQTKEIQKKIEKFQKAYDLLNEIVQGNHNDKDLIKTYTLVKSLDSGYSSYDWDLQRFKDLVSKLSKIERSLFKARGYDENTDVSKIKEELQKELEQVDKELEDVKSDAFQKKLFNEIVSKKEKLSIKGGDLKSRVNDFSELNHLLSYKFTDVDHSSCTIPTKELKVSRPKTDDSKIKRLKLAKAKAKALKLKLLVA